MNLNGINVLVDGYNLEMQKGTGIKTYGATLLQALVSLGANVDLLCSRDIDTASPLLAESMFFDNQDTRKRTKVGTLLSIARQFFLPSKKTYTISRDRKFIIKQSNDNVFNYLTEASNIFNARECYALSNSLYKLLKFQTTIKIPKRIDLWHATYPIPIKINGAKKITTIHDLIPLKLPYTTLDDKKFFFNNINHAVKNSEIILTVSENTKQDILTCFDIHPEKIFVTHQPIVNEGLDSVKEDLLEGYLRKYTLEASKYILFVGAIEPKKNVGRLIDAYIDLDTDMKLVIVGKKAWLWKDELYKLEMVFGGNFSAKVKLLDYVPKKDLGYLYKGAFCLVFPSLYEGFGLPPLEAMSFDCPVITSNVSSLPEVCGDAAIYVDPYDSNDIRAGIEKLINSPQVRSQLIDSGKERVKFFGMENYVKKLHQAYTKIL